MKHFPSSPQDGTFLPLLTSHANQAGMLVCLTAENLGKPCQHYGAGLLELFLRALGMTIDSALFSLVPVVSNTEGQSHYPVAETMVESIA